MIFPVGTDSIQLVSEAVVIHLASGWRPGHTECTYVLRNLATTAQSFEMAFVTGPPFATTPEGYRQHYNDANFVVRLDDVPLQVSRAPVARGRWTHLVDSPPDSLPAWHLRMAAHATARLLMTYDISWSGGSDGGHTTTEFTYHARPAALWAGVIEEASIAFRLDPLATTILECGPQLGTCFSFSIHPSGYRWHAEGFSWEFENWEPMSDFTFHYETYRKMP